MRIKLQARIETPLREQKGSGGSVRVLLLSVTQILQKFTKPPTMDWTIASLEQETPRSMDGCG